jgi:electron transport complex protein RnfC
MAISIESAPDEKIDGDFGKIAEKEPFNAIKDFLLSCPGGIPSHLFSNNNGQIQTLVVCGVDSDLLITTNQYMVKAETNSIKDGIDILRKAIPVEKIIFAVPRHLKHEASAADAVTKIVAPQYPAASPRMIMKDVLGHVVPAGKTCEDMGVAFISAEAVASIGSAFKDGVIPVNKKITVIKKDGNAAFVSARIGTPLSNIFDALGIHLNEKDRIVFGGPMTGTAAYSADLPVLPDTDAVIVQDFSTIPLVSDYPCINCGECIRMCPANVPINMLVRFLEAGFYEQAEDEYDLQSCIDCGLCSYVCPARIPIFQYIKLAKHELSRLQAEEEAAEEVNTEEVNNE